MSWEETAPDGVYRIDGSNVVFLEPCRIISSYYSHFSALPHRYYSRSFFLSHCRHHAFQTQASNQLEKKRKRKKTTAYVPNLKELIAQRRHEEMRKLILDAHAIFLASLKARSLLKALEGVLHEHIGSEHFLNSKCEEQDQKNGLIDFVELGDVWQAPLYQITLSRVHKKGGDCEGSPQEGGKPFDNVSLFKHMVHNSSNEEIIGSFADTRVILPKQGCFVMSDLASIRHTLLSAKGDGFNLILIDPPWENKSVHRHALYSTLPNRYLLSLPLQQLAHHQGALVGLWVTNREKLRVFVENELFPAWSSSVQAVWYWLKVKLDGYMITELDVLHHKPYECLLLGYIPSHDSMSDSQIHVPKVVPDKQVLISIPGDHSRKPPLTTLLSAHVPGVSVRGLELFARDMHPGWTSWGNEPLHFQQMPNFCNNQIRY